MTGVDLKLLLNKCNDFLTSALTTAAGQAVTRTHYEVTIEHLFLACVRAEHGDMSSICAHFGLEAAEVTRKLTIALEDFRTGNTGRPVFSPLLLELLEHAWLVSSVDLGLPHIRSGSLLLAFLRKSAVYAQGDYGEVFAPINREELLRNFQKITSASQECVASTTPQEGRPTGHSESFIAQFCEDFTEKAKSGKIDPVFGRDEEIRQIVDVLARRRKNNPILVGDPGVGKTAVLEGLALRIVTGDVPEVLAGVRLLGLDLGLLEAGASMKGEFERRLKGVLDEIKASEVPIVLFIDEAHMLVGAGGTTGGSDAANLMKPALARGEIRTCAATTWKEYKKYFEKDAALARRFQLVKLDEPSVATSVLILRGLRHIYEEAHKVEIRDDAIVAAAQLAHRYIAGRFLPDKAIDLLDTACARVKVRLSCKPAELEDLEHALAADERERASLFRDQENGARDYAERIAELDERIREQRELCAKRTSQWQEERSRIVDYQEAKAKGSSDEKGKAPLLKEGNIAIDVTADVVAQVVSDWTGIPVGRMAKEQSAITKDLDTLLAQRIVGQKAALTTITKGIQAASAGLKAPNQPMGVFLLVGPSGVGKTETALALAELLFGDENCLITIAMSEFQEKHTVSRLIGSPPGYVGFGEGGMLTEAVRRRPYSVVLLDEAEKAHIDVLNLFYQVFDKGVLTDGEGVQVRFTNSIILLTSNLASDIIQEWTGDDPTTLLADIRPVLSAHFRPALLARMTIVPYVSLPKEALSGIAQRKLEQVAQRLKENKGLELTWSPEVVAQIVARCTETESGARNIEAILSHIVLPRLAYSILQEMSASSLPTAVALGVDSKGQFTLSF